MILSQEDNSSPTLMSRAFNLLKIPWKPITNIFLLGWPKRPIMLPTPYPRATVLTNSIFQIDKNVNFCQHKTF